MNDDEAKAHLSGAVTFTFGDNETLCHHLLDLVRSGKKTATCGALREFGPGRDALPEVGRRDVALNWDGSPALLLETLDVFRLPFCDVDETFALAEGENDSLAGWRKDHQAYFERNGGFDNNLLLVCERFRLVYDYESEAS